MALVQNWAVFTVERHTMCPTWAEKTKKEGYSIPFCTKSWKTYNNQNVLRHATLINFPADGRRAHQ